MNSVNLKNVVASIQHGVPNVAKIIGGNSVSELTKRTVDNQSIVVKTFIGPDRQNQAAREYNLYNELLLNTQQSLLPRYYPKNGGDKVYMSDCDGDLLSGTFTAEEIFNIWPALNEKLSSSPYKFMEREEKRRESSGVKLTYVIKKINYGRHR